MDFTSLIVAVIAFAVTALLGYVVIPYLRKLKFGQTILEIGPNWHKDKQGTPTMGGVMFIIGTVLSLVLGFVYAVIFKKPFFVLAIQIFCTKYTSFGNIFILSKT